MKHIIKKFLLTISLIFSLGCFQPCYAIYGPEALVAETAVNIGTFGAIMLASAISSINARGSVQENISETTLELYENVSGTLTLIPSDKDIVLKKAPATQIFVYKNTGGSNWLNPSVSWQTMFDDPDPIAHPTGSEFYVALKNNTCNSLSSIAPGGSCSFSLVTYANHPGDWGIIKTTGSNLLGGIQLKNVLAGSGLEITMNLDTTKHHLGYRSIKLTNTIPDGDIHIRDIALGENLAPAIDPFVKYCAPNDTDCAYPTDCTISETRVISLAPNASCLVWLKAQSKKTDNTTDIALQTIPVATGRIKIIVDAEKQIQGEAWVDISNYEKDSTFKTAYNNSLYAGGDFNTVDGITVNGIARWDGTNWSTLGSGINDAVYHTIYDFNRMNGDLYASGAFITIGGVTVNNIAKWNGAVWSALGSGTNRAPTALASIGSNLYAGGNFDSAGGVSVSCIAQWNGTTWSPLGSGVASGGFPPPFIQKLTTIGTDLYAGGEFIMAGSSSAINIAKWDSVGSSWSPLGASGSGTNNTVLALTSIGKLLYVGGSFTLINGTLSAKYVAQWNSLGSSWSALVEGASNGTNAPIQALTITTNNDLYVGGNFTTAGLTSPANRIARWNGTNWFALDVGTDAGVYSLTSINNDVYAGGFFANAGTIVPTSANYIAKWNGTNWSPLGLNTMDSIPRALIIAPALDVNDYAWPGT